MKGKNVLAALAVFFLACGVVAGCMAGMAVAAEQPEKVDVDLTALSSTMVFGELFNMMMNPQNYLGKTLKMRGAYSSSHSEETNNDYHFVVIADAAACCQQGMEFILNGSQDPADYPAANTRIEVVGTFESYKVLDYVHYYVKTEEIAVL